MENKETENQTNISSFFRDELISETKKRLLWTVILILFMVIYAFIIMNQNISTSKTLGYIDNNRMKTIEVIANNFKSNPDDSLIDQKFENLISLVTNSDTYNEKLLERISLSLVFILILGISLSMLRSSNNRIQSILKYIEKEHKFINIKDTYLNEDSEVKIALLSMYFDSSISDNNSKIFYENITDLFSKIKFEKKKTDK